MFDRYMLVEGSLENWSENGKTAGFQLDVHYPHHCGIWLSIIERIDLCVDGRALPKERMQLLLDGNAYPVQTLTEQTEGRWYFGQPGTLRVSLPGGLTPGTHEVRVMMALRVSFLDWLLTGEDTKQMLVKQEGKQA